MHYRRRVARIHSAHAGSAPARRHGPALQAFSALSALCALPAQAQVGLADSRMLSGIDARALEAAAQLPLPQQLERVHPGAPFWRGHSAGVQWTQQHIQIAAGHQLWLLVPAGAALHIEQAQPGSALQFWRSNGSGLLLAQQIAAVPGGGWRLQEAGQSDDSMQQARLYLVELPASAPQAESLSLALRRPQAFANLALYPELVAAASPSRVLRMEQEAVAQSYWQVGPEQRQEFMVQGPARLAVRSRALFGAPAVASAQAEWQLQVQLADAAAPLSGPLWQARAESRQMLYLDEQPALLSEARQAWLDLPAGAHRLQLRASQPALLQIWKSRAEPYLHAANAGHRLPQDDAAQARFVTDPWTLDEAKLEQAAQAGLAAWAHAAPRLAQDMRRRGSSSAAAAIWRSLGAARPDVPAAQQAAREAAQELGFWRDLLPHNKPLPQAERYAWFLQQRLREPGEREWGRIIASAHEQAWLDGLQGVRLAALGVGQEQALRYHLPAREAASSLRLALPAGQAGAGHKLWLQFDQQPPFVLQLQDSAPAQHFAPDAVAAALQAQALRLGQDGAPAPALQAGSTWSALFAHGGAQPRESAALIQAQHLDIALPAQVREVRLWREQAAAQNSPAVLYAGVQWRAGRQWRMQESDWLAAWQAGDSEQGLHDLQQALRGQVPHGPAAQRDSQLQELARLIGSENNLFSQSVSPPPVTPEIKPQHVQKLAQARSLLAQQQWLPALELWSPLTHHPEPGLQLEARAAQWQAMLALGELNLAEQLARQRLLYDTQGAAREQARAHLQQLYAFRQDAPARLTLAAVALAQLRRADGASDPRLLQEFVHALQANDQSESALQAASLLPRAWQPHNLLLGWCLERQWQAAFEVLQSKQKHAAAREYWQALAHARNAQWQAAMQGFSLAHDLAALHPGALEPAYGEPAAWRDWLREGLQLQQSLQAARADAAALRDLRRAWGAWQDKAPGPWRWRDAPGLLQDHDGAQTLYASQRDHYQYAWRSTAQRALQLKVHGPVRLRISARALHAQPERQQALQAWFKLHVHSLHEGEQQRALYTLPLRHDRALPQWRLAGEEGLGVGQAVWRELELGAGEHRLELSGQGADVLWQVQQARPQIEVPLLPWLQADTPLAPAPLFDPQTFSLVREAGWFGCRTCHQILQPQGAGAAGARALLQAAWPRSAGLPATPPPPSPAQPTPLAQGRSAPQLLARGADIAAIAALPAPAERNAARDWLQALLWRLEQGDSLPKSLLAKAFALQQAHPDWLELGALVDALTHNSDWELQTSVQGSAGMRSRALTHWQPEAPAMRVRRALLGQSVDGEYLLSGDTRLLLNLESRAAQTMELLLQQRDVARQPAQALRAAMQIGNGEVREFVLQAGAPQRISLALTRGQQVLKLWLKQGWANQFLSVRAIHHPGLGVQAENERFYHVASAREPLRLLLPGPAWVRLDSWREGQTHSQYLLLNEAENKLKLGPPPGEKEGLYRVFVRQAGAPRMPATPRPQTAQLLAAPAPMFSAAWLAQLDAGARAAAAPDSAPAPLSAQAGPHLAPALSHRAVTRGTGSLYASLLPRQGQPLSFESGASYRYFDEDGHNWYRAELFARRDNAASGASQARAHLLGLQGHYLHDPGWRGWQWGAQAALLWRQENGSQKLQGGAQAFVRQSRVLHPDWMHQPQARIFIRQSASAQDAALLGGDATQSSTPARNLGLEISDKLSYRPWQDAIASAQLRLQSGASLLPDTAHVQAQWQQMRGAHRFGLRYDSSLLREGGRLRNSNHSVRMQLNSEHWLAQQQRLELGVFVQRDLSRRAWSAGIGLTLHLNGGRDLRDFSPDELAWRELRRRRQVSSGE
ncbi:hypothetical protein V8J88_08170 [Massilia sp. W12]|uniref:hypothetical protein n=1 Tax=Massilia sp. W12 TaxID=3126507 RepID=UPI0030D41B78